MIKDIERMLNSFWWGGGAENKGIRWLSWDRMTYPKELGGMGFRNLHCFNMSMVAKQGWKFMMYPDSLVAKIYKARYFPNSTLFESHLGSNPTYAWRSIWNSRQVLMNGCRWKIGKGTNIRVMGEPWLREEDGLRIKGPEIQGVYQMNVNQLFLPNMKAWDRRKIEALFSLDTANAILEVPLFDMVEDDKLVWYDDACGNYSVKSGYNLMLKYTGRAEALKEEGDWKNIWKTHAPPKTKHLLWRICKGCLPTRTRLNERFVNCPLICPICEHHNEDDWHAFFCCNDALFAWKCAGLETQILAYIQSYCNVKDIIMNVCRNENEEVVGLFAMVLWMLWNNRNNCLWKDEKEAGRNIGIKALVSWAEWRQVQLVRTSSSAAIHRQQEQNIQQWVKPPFEWYKCNVDAGFYNEGGKTSAGWCVRDHTGQFIMAGTSWIQGRCSIIEGEAMTLMEAMKEVASRGINHVIFETDSKRVVDATQKLHKGVSEFSSIICNIQRLLSLNSNFKVKFAKRQANMVAHTLARAAIFWTSRYFHEILPTCIETILINEMF